MFVQKSYRDETSGKLYLVATPIGNLEDMTFRAVRTLKEVNWIAAEDTRQTRKLLTHFDISTRMVSYHEHNKASSGPELIRLLLSGDSIALVSDAGTPAISDPGYDLVCMAIERHIDVIPIPGANAALSSLIISGMATDRFTFVGFLPRDRKSIHKELEPLGQAAGTLMFYESPHRVQKTLGYMAEVFGADRQVCLVRELTKRYEEAVRGTIQQCLDHLQEHAPQGEYCIIVAGASTAPSRDDESWWATLTPEEHVAHYETADVTRKEAIKLAAADRGMPKRDLYNLIHQ
ncbi:16S rRNA (cytidine(1402)-2'-O)-methyltransferase [Paenibacillus thalictri]|uniref:Ribosomal RNA small subunit methyltransferase I n=1 Tax=Paenibacillus thalictri TaxID=2527873 RepID=A0A4Q9DFB4_9BACL|nr:16S rRNA (cytidine(1402)-2'-O)-methyltransferase [Paenibacillus thalictri]TBL69005.1 16S rRNA (cytidine(1402)-2'-O)-methyltransferase [Paenibacillus thalictri]